VQIEINEPEVLRDLCDYLSRHGFIALAASRERADVLVPERVATSLRSCS